jgi:cell wall-associated NlpC family hydrolase
MGRFRSERSKDPGRVMPRVGGGVAGVPPAPRPRGTGASGFTMDPPPVPPGLTTAPNNAALQQQLISMLQAHKPDVFGISGLIHQINTPLPKPPPALAPYHVPAVRPQAPGNQPVLHNLAPAKSGAGTAGAAAAHLATKFLGTPYVWGGESPKGFDCSGLLQYVWSQKGVHIPRVTYDQWRAGRPVGKRQLQPGDAVFFHMGPKGPEHVGMYIGHGKFIEAPHRGANARISRLAGRGDFVGARRYR